MSRVLIGMNGARLSFHPQPSYISRIVALAAIAMLACPAGMGQPATPLSIAPIGRLIDAGGHRLHINCTGEGSPTVVMESGALDLSLVWALTQPKVAQFTRACSYDRAGYAWSDAGPQPRTMAQIAYELHTALANAGEKGPYVLVGASLGGAIVRVFANTYPNDVSGMVLVDSIHENDYVIENEKAVRYRETSQKREIPPVQATFKTDESAADPLVVRATKSSKFIPDNPRSKLPPDLQRIWMIARKQIKYSRAGTSEFLFLPEEMDKLGVQTAAAPQPLGKKPLIVLTRDAAFNRAPQGMTVAELNNDRNSLQAKLATLSANSKLVTVKEAEREIQLCQPDTVASAIREVVQAAQAHAPLH
jgi:pimeloyl-ACP methyl ester carboxylesterase